MDPLTQRRLVGLLAGLVGAAAWGYGSIILDGISLAAITGLVVGLAGLAYFAVTYSRPPLATVQPAPLLAGTLAAALVTVLLVAWIFGSRGTLPATGILVFVILATLVVAATLAGLRAKA